jgi:hypothetical protein
MTSRSPEHTPSDGRLTTSHVDRERPCMCDLYLHDLEKDRTGTFEYYRMTVSKSRPAPKVTHQVYSQTTDTIVLIVTERDYITPIPVHMIDCFPWANQPRLIAPEWPIFECGRNFPRIHEPETLERLYTDNIFPAFSNCAGSVDARSVNAEINCIQKSLWTTHAVWSHRLCLTIQAYKRTLQPSTLITPEACNILMDNLRFPITSKFTPVLSTTHFPASASYTFNFQHILNMHNVVTTAGKDSTLKTSGASLTMETTPGLLPTGSKKPRGGTEPDDEYILLGPILPEVMSRCIQEHYKRTGMKELIQFLFSEETHWLKPDIYVRLRALFRHVPQWMATVSFSIDGCLYASSMKLPSATFYAAYRYHVVESSEPTHDNWDTLMQQAYDRGGALTDAERYRRALASCRK